MAGFEPVICPEAAAIRVLAAAGQPVGRNRGDQREFPFQLEPRRLVGRALRRGPSRITLWFETAN